MNLHFHGSLPGEFSSRAKQKEREAVHSLPSSAEVKNGDVVFNYAQGRPASFACLVEVVALSTKG